MFAVNSNLVRRLSAKVPSTYVCALLRSAEKAAPNEPIGDITIEQTPYFDMSDDQEFARVLTVLLEDHDKIEKRPDRDLDDDPLWH